MKRVCTVLVLMVVLTFGLSVRMGSGASSLGDHETPRPTKTFTPTPINTPTDTVTPTPTDTVTPTPTITPTPIIGGLQYRWITSNCVGVINTLQVVNASSVPSRVSLAVHWWLWGWVRWPDVFDQWVGPWETVQIHWIPELPLWWDLKLSADYSHPILEYFRYEWQIFIPNSNICHFVFLPITLK